eukprot:scpid81659/ scgid25196/ Mannose-1-phosphate guanyltransferase alpha-A; GDP-mannose pyrophosphorylase A-A; GTP-mannose-1-phosphate guanylyltransferase subunit alpha-A
MMLKAVILIGGPQKGTRFRPLSLEVPKPLFPIAGLPMIQHHMEACVKVDGLKEILLIGFYQNSEPLNRFVRSMQSELSVKVRYLQEYTPLGTAGGLYHFRDQIMSGSPDAVFVLNADVCCDLPLQELLAFHKSHSEGNGCTVLGTRANRKQAVNYGCIVENEQTGEVMHYVEKPESFVSDIINCGTYVVSSDVFQHIGQVFSRNYERSGDDEGLGIETQGTRDVIRLEQDVLVPLAGSGKLFVYKTERFWTQVKNAGSAIYASRLFFEKYAADSPERLTRSGDSGTEQPCIVGNVRIHPTASVDRTATIGPNVYIGPGVVVRAGARIRESIVLDRAEVGQHSCILHSIVGWNGSIGAWARVEGTPNDPNPNDPFARVQVQSIFGSDGRLNPSITILGQGVHVPGEVSVRNCIVLPFKELSGSLSNEIIL